MKSIQLAAIAVYFASIGAYAVGPIQRRQEPEPTNSPSTIFNPSGSFSIDATNTDTDSPPTLPDPTGSFSVDGTNTDDPAPVPQTTTPTDTETTPTGAPTDGPETEEPTNSPGEDGGNGDDSEPEGSGGEGWAVSLSVGGGVKALALGVAGVQAVHMLL